MRAPHRTKYAGDWTKESSDRVARHIATYGHICPGWKREAHPSQDLTTDHGPPPQVMCRGCNTRKRNLGDG